MRHPRPLSTAVIGDPPDRFDPFPENPREAELEDPPVWCARCRRHPEQCECTS